MREAVERRRPAARRGPAARRRAPRALGAVRPRCAIPSATIASHLQPRVERAERVLEDDLRLAAGTRAARPARRAARPARRSRPQPPVASISRSIEPRERALAAAALADQRRASRRADVEVDVADRLEPARRRARRSRGRPGSASSGPGRASSGSARRRRRGVVAAELTVRVDRLERRVLLDAASGCGSGSAAAKRQAGGIACSSGTRPAITGRRSPGLASSGMLRSSPWV